jgi:hypothetical protein
MQCPSCGATAADNLLECTRCSGPIGLTVLTSDGRQYGPYTLAALRQYVAEGHINAADSRARIGAGAWAPLRNILAWQTADASVPSRQADSQREWWARQVPYRNAPALASYYVGVFSFVPCVGMLLALVAIPLGIVGLKHAAEHPQSYGRSHAWTGIVLGALSLIGHAVAIVLLGVR